jgi:flagellar biosynthesis protein FliR
MELSVATYLGAAMALGMRISGLMLFAPFFGSMAIPPRVKAMLVILITAVIYPTYAARVTATTLSQWIFLVGSELVIGIALGVATNFVFDAALMAGQVLSVQMGYSLVNILDPQTRVDTTVVSVFHQTMAMLIFLQLDVHHWILRAIGNSFAYMPPGSVTINGSFVTALLHGAASVLGVGVQIAAPVLAATLVADVALGLLGKASPQMPLLLLGPALKSIAGLLILTAAMAYWPGFLERRFAISVQYAERLLHLAH